MLAVLVARARANGARELRGVFHPTTKNNLVRDHYAKLGFSKTSETDQGDTSWALLLGDFVPSCPPIEILEREFADSWAPAAVSSK